MFESESLDPAVERWLLVIHVALRENAGFHFEIAAKTQEGSSLPTEG